MVNQVEFVQGALKQWETELAEREAGRGTRSEEGSLFLWSVDYCRSMVARLKQELAELKGQSVQK